MHLAVNVHTMAAWDAVTYVIAPHFNFYQPWRKPKCWRWYTSPFTRAPQYEDSRTITMVPCLSCSINSTLNKEGSCFLRQEYIHSSASLISEMFHLGPTSMSPGSPQLVHSLCLACALPCLHLETLVNALGAFSSLKWFEVTWKWLGQTECTNVGILCG